MSPRMATGNGVPLPGPTRRVAGERAEWGRHHYARFLESGDGSLLERAIGEMRCPIRRPESAAAGLSRV